VVCVAVCSGHIAGIWLQFYSLWSRPVWGERALSIRTKCTHSVICKPWPACWKESGARQRNQPDHVVCRALLCATDQRQRNEDAVDHASVMGGGAYLLGALAGPCHDGEGRAGMEETRRRNDEATKRRNETRRDNTQETISWLSSMFGPGRCLSVCTSVCICMYIPICMVR